MRLIIQCFIFFAASEQAWAKGTSVTSARAWLEATSPLQNPKLQDACAAESANKAPGRMNFIAPTKTTTKVHLGGHCQNIPPCSLKKDVEYSCGIVVTTGTSCGANMKTLKEIEAAQGKPYIPAGQSTNPWLESRYIDDTVNSGNNIKMNLNFSEFSQQNIEGKLALLFDADGNPIACGEILPVAVYPG